MNIVDRLIEENQGRSALSAIDEGGRRITYDDLFRAVDAWRVHLAAAGIRRHDRVGFLCDDSADYIVVALAILASGAALVPISPSLSINDLMPAMRSTDAHWLIHDDAVPVSDVHGHALDGPPLKRSFQLARLPASGDRDARFAALNPAFVRFSSGTTGSSKGVILSHQAIVERTEAADRVLRITTADRIPWVLSMSYHFVVTILLFLRRGACIVLCGHNVPAELIRRLAAGDATFLYASPFHYHLLVAARDVTASMIAPVRMAISTAMPLSSDLAERFAARFGKPLCQAYGIIEVGLPFIQSPEIPRKPGSVGPLGDDYDIQLKDPDTHGVGEVLLRGKGMFSAYIDPWQTREQIDPNRWFHTGDLGRLDADGHLFLLGRVREVINFAGMKVFPTAVETVLNHYPGVHESQVYGEPHPRYGQWPIARIVIADGQPFDVNGLRRHCYQRLSPHQVPKRIDIVSAIDKTASGKIKRHPN